MNDHAVIRKFMGIWLSKKALIRWIIQGGNPKDRWI